MAARPLRERLTSEQIDVLLAFAAEEATDWYFYDAPENRSLGADKSWCPYNRRGLPGADPHGTCSFGCVEEPACQTEGPWPLEEVAEVLSVIGYFEEEE